MGTVYFNRLSSAYQIYNVHLNLLMKWLLGSNHSRFYQIYITNYSLAPNIMQSKFNLLQTEEFESQGKRPSHLVLAK